MIKGEQQSIKRQMPLNLVSNVLLFLINLVVGLWLVPFLIKNLGVEGYGLIPLATQLTNYVQLLTIAINGAVSRYLTIAIQRNDIVEANKIFNTAFFALTIFLIFLVPLIVIFALSVPQIFDVPSKYNKDAQLLFLAIMVMFVVSTWKSNFAISPYALNRLDLRNSIDISSVILRVLIIVFLFKTIGPALYQVGIGYLGGAIFGLILSVVWWKKLTPDLNIKFKYFSVYYFKELISTSGWLVVNQVGTLLFLSIDLIVVNKLFGATAGGEYAAVLQWSTLLRSIAGILAGITAPVILIYFAKKQKEQLIRLSIMSVKFIGLAMALPIGGIGGFAHPLLKIWLGPEFTHLAPLLLLMVSHLLINLPVLPLFHINIATNSVRVPGMVTIVMGFGNLFLALALPFVLGWGYYGVAAAGAIMLTCKNAVFTPWYACCVLGIPRCTFSRAMLPGVIWGIAIAGLAYLFTCLMGLSTWPSLICAGVILTIFYSLTIWYIVLNKEEKVLILSLIPNRKIEG